MTAARAASTDTISSIPRTRTGAAASTPQKNKQLGCTCRDGVVVCVWYSIGSDGSTTAAASIDPLGIVVGAIDLRQNLTSGAAGRNASPGGASSTSRADWPLDTLDALDTLVALIALVTLNTLVTLQSLNALDALDALVTLVTFQALDTLDTLNALDTLLALNALRAGVTDWALVALNALNTLNTLRAG